MPKKVINNEHFADLRGEETWRKRGDGLFEFLNGGGRGFIP